jgi:HEPN domain-containing protein
LLKSFLIYHNKEVKRTHNLTLLQTECSEIDESFTSFNFDDYNYYSVDVRYPDEFYIPTINEAKEIFQTANQFKDFVLAKIQ